MREISDYFEKFRKLQPKDAVVKEIIISFVFENNQVLLEKNSIDVSKKNIFLKINPLLKTKIFLQKEALVKKIREKTRGLYEIQ